MSRRETTFLHTVDSHCHLLPFLGEKERSEVYTSVLSRSHHNNDEEGSSSSSSRHNSTDTTTKKLVKELSTKYADPIVAWIDSLRVQQEGEGEEATSNRSSSNNNMNTTTDIDTTAKNSCSDDGPGPQVSAVEQEDDVYVSEEKAEAEAETDSGGGGLSVVCGTSPLLDWPDVAVLAAAAAAGPTAATWSSESRQSESQKRLEEKQQHSSHHRIVPGFGIHPWYASDVVAHVQVPPPPSRSSSSLPPPMNNDGIQSEGVERTNAASSGGRGAVVQCWDRSWWADTLCEYLEAHPGAAVGEIGLDHCHLTKPQPQPQTQATKPHLRPRQGHDDDTKVEDRDSKEEQEGSGKEKAVKNPPPLPIICCVPNSDANGDVTATEVECVGTASDDVSKEVCTAVVHPSPSPDTGDPDAVRKAREEKKRLKQLKVESAKNKKASKQMKAEKGKEEEDTTQTKQIINSDMTDTEEHQKKDNETKNNNNKKQNKDKDNHILLLERQRKVFETQLSIAAYYSRPVSVHCVRAWGAMLDILTARVEQYIRETTASIDSILLTSTCSLPESLPPDSVSSYENNEHDERDNNKTNSSWSSSSSSAAGSAPYFSSSASYSSTFPLLLLPPAFVFHGFTGSPDFVRSIDILISQRLGRHLSKLQKQLKKEISKRNSFATTVTTTSTAPPPPPPSAQLHLAVSSIAAIPRFYYGIGVNTTMQCKGWDSLLPSAPPPPFPPLSGTTPIPTSGLLLSPSSSPAKHKTTKGDSSFPSAVDVIVVAHHGTSSGSETHTGGGKTNGSSSSSDAVTEGKGGTKKKKANSGKGKGNTQNSSMTWDMLLFETDAFDPSSMAGLLQQAVAAVAEKKMVRQQLSTTTVTDCGSVSPGCGSRSQITTREQEQDFSVLQRRLHRLSSVNTRDVFLWTQRSGK